VAGSGQVGRSWTPCVACMACRRRGGHRGSPRRGARAVGGRGRTFALGIFTRFAANLAAGVADGPLRLSFVASRRVDHHGQVGESPVTELFDVLVHRLRAGQVGARLSRCQRFGAGTRRHRRHCIDSLLQPRVGDPPARPQLHLRWPRFHLPGDERLVERGDGWDVVPVRPGTARRRPGGSRPGSSTERLRLVAHHHRGLVPRRSAREAAPDRLR
jgi:hypothetical protein